MSTYRELTAEGNRRLLQAGISDAGTDAWYLLEHLTGMGREAYLLRREEEAEEETAREYFRLIGLRKSHIPLQQLTGEAWFMGLSFRVNEHVLIPRLDTEILVDEVRKALCPGMRILDLCTGSGCILLTLLSLTEGVEGVGTDLSKEALKVAGANARKLAAEGILTPPLPKWVESDLFEGLEGRYSVIVSNPPYIPGEAIGGLMPEVREHEPRLALDGGMDGLDFYRRIAKEAGEYLEAEGQLFLEIGHDQGAAVSRLLEENGFREIRVVKDLAGLDRVVCSRRW